MPRGPRLDAPGILHHVWARGIERCKIFLSDGDRMDFLARLAEVCSENAASVYAWCLMDNHFHLQIRTGVKPLPKLMRRLLTGYAMGFNKRSRRSGHLFQNRYKSTVVDEEKYFLALVRYIHRNPLRAAIVKTVEELSRYPWSGFSALMGHQKVVWQNVDEVLLRFGKQVGKARQELWAFMEMNEAKQDEPIFKGGGLVRSMGGVANVDTHRRTGDRWLSDERILGESQFVEGVLRRATTQAVRTMPIADADQRWHQFDRLVEVVCEKFAIQKEEILSNSKRRAASRARQVLAYLSRNYLGLNAAEVSRAIGVSGQSVLIAADKGPAILNELNLSPENFIGD